MNESDVCFISNFSKVLFLAIFGGVCCGHFLCLRTCEFPFYRMSVLSTSVCGVCLSMFCSRYFCLHFLAAFCVDKLFVSNRLYIHFISLLCSLRLSLSTFYRLFPWFLYLSSSVAFIVFVSGDTVPNRSHRSLCIEFQCMGCLEPVHVRQETLIYWFWIISGALTRTPLSVKWSGKTTFHFWYHLKSAWRRQDWLGDDFKEDAHTLHHHGNPYVASLSEMEEYLCHQIASKVTCLFPEIPEYSGPIPLTWRR